MNIPVELINVLIQKIASSVSHNDAIIRVPEGYLYFKNLEHATQFVTLFRMIVGNIPINILLEANALGANVVISYNDINTAATILSELVQSQISKNIRFVMES